MVINELIYCPNTSKKLVIATKYHENFVAKLNMLQKRSKKSHEKATEKQKKKWQRITTVLLRMFHGTIVTKVIVLTIVASLQKKYLFATVLPREYLWLL